MRFSLGLFLLSGLANGVHLSEKYFTQHGGNLNDKAGTYWTVYKPLFDDSFTPPGNSDVKLNSQGSICSGTYLGESNEGGKTYYWVLTAAHCLGQNGRSGQGTKSGYWRGVLYDYELNYGALQGTWYLPDQRANGKDNLPSYSTDIAMLKLEKYADLKGRNGHNLEAAVVYAGNQEQNKVAKIYGQGSWGVGNENHGEWSTPDNTGLFRRAYGESYIDGYINQAALSLAWDPSDGTGNHRWSRIAEGDSGGSTYAQINGKWVLVGVNQGYSSAHGVAVRVAYYANSFIKSLFSNVQLEN